MLADYQLLAREQLICGTQVHVGVDDRDEAVAVAHRVAPYLPTLLALSASSPFWADGSDTGYSSGRTLVWQRWPTTGLAAPVSSAAEYDKLVSDLVASGVIADAGMVYFDVRPAVAAPTLELRICDSCPSVDTIVLIAGLFRALVEREVEGCGQVCPRSRSLRRWVGPRCGGRRDRGWRANSSTSTVRAAGRRPMLSPNSCGRCARSSRRRVTGRSISDLTRQVLIAGISAARQRRALAPPRSADRRRRPVDRRDRGQLAEHGGRGDRRPDAAVRLSPRASSTTPPRPPPRATTKPSTPAAGRGPTTKSPAHRRQLGVAVLRSREGAIEQEQRADNITFRVSGQSRAQVFPLDLMPRLVSAEEWAQLSVGLGQRARALNAFLRDIYSEQAIVERRRHRAARAGPGTRIPLDGPASPQPGPCAHQRHRCGLRPGRTLDGARGQPAHPVGHRVRGRQPAAAVQASARTRPAGRHR